MRITLSLIGIVLSYLLIRYREAIGDMLGEADWMRSVGGIYTIVVFIALFIFFWSLAELTGTTHIFLSPVRYLIPGAQPPPTAF